MIFKENILQLNKQNPKIVKVTMSICLTFLHLPYLAISVNQIVSKKTPTDNISRLKFLIV